MAQIAAHPETSADHLRLVLSMGQIGIWELDVVTGSAWRTPRHDAIFGYDEPLSSWTYDQFLGHVFSEDRDLVDRLQQDAIARGEDWIFECRIRRADGVVRWISAAGRPLKDADGNVTKLIGHVIDITRTKENESRLRMVTQELNHRVRNMLALMRAMIGLSARDAKDIPTFSRALEGRVAALARSHDLIATNEGATFAPQQILERELGAFPELQRRVAIDSQGTVPLRGQQAENFALVTHELLTNAIKYGALSNEDGAIAIAIGETDSGNALLTWTERGGPPVSPPDGRGFGTRMICSLLAGQGAVDLDFRPGGLIATIQLARRAD